MRQTQEDETQKALRMREWNAWHSVCDALLKAGAVTAEDLKSLASDNKTDGQRLFHLIREWGQAFAECHYAE